MKDIIDLGLRVDFFDRINDMISNQVESKYMPKMIM